MRRATDLEQRLVDWGREYGGSRYESASSGASPLASLMKWHGRAPQGLGYAPMSTAADEVQKAVEALAKQTGGLAPAMVLRCEYLTPGQPNEAKRSRLRAVGQAMGRVRYYQHLFTARVYVAGCLQIAFSPSCAEEMRSHDDDSDADCGVVYVQKA